MSGCAWCGGPHYLVLPLGSDASVAICEACRPELLSVLAEPVHMPGRNSPCPECLENGITIKLKKCKEHNDEQISESLEGGQLELPQHDERTEKKRSMQRRSCRRVRK